MKTILLVDDTSQLRGMTADFLKRKNYSVITAKDGAEGLKKFQQLLNDQNVDLVITDYNMPKLDGWQIAVEIRKLNPEMPIIMVSGNIADAYERALRLGINKLMSRPFEFKDLLAAVKKLFNEKS